MAQDFAVRYRKALGMVGALFKGDPDEADALSVPVTVTSSVLNIGGQATIDGGVSSGTARKLGGVAYASTALSTTVSGGSGAQAYSTAYAAPANSFVAGAPVKIRAVVKAIARNGTDTSTFALRIGGQTIATSATGQATANDRIILEARVIPWAVPGASVTCAYEGGCRSTNGGVFTIQTSSGTVTLATNGALTIDAAVTYSSTNTGNQSALESLTVEF